MAGANRFEALVTPDSIDMMTAMKKGSKLVVLDPRFTKTASLANEWYSIRPGTDMAFFLAIAHIMILRAYMISTLWLRKFFGIEQFSGTWHNIRPNGPQGSAKSLPTTFAASPARWVRPHRQPWSIQVAEAPIMKTPPRSGDPLPLSTPLLGNWDRPGGLTAKPKSWY